MSLPSEITALEGDILSERNPESLAVRWNSAKRATHTLLVLCCEWIDASLLEEPVAFSEDHGNLVLIHERLGKLASGLKNRFADVVLESIDDADLADRLNAHYAIAIELRPLLNSLRRRCYRDDSILARLIALKKLRQNYPKIRRFADEMHAAEPILAAWLRSPNRSESEILAAHSFLQTQRPNHRSLKEAERLTHQLAKTAFKLHAQEQLKDALAEVDTQLESGNLPAADRLVQEIRRLAIAGGQDADDPTQDVASVIEKINSVRDMQRLQILAIETIDTLERALEESRDVRVIETSYAEACKNAGQIPEALDARVRRRLSIERASRRTRNRLTVAATIVILAGLAVLLVFTWRSQQRTFRILELSGIVERHLHAYQTSEAIAVLDETVDVTPELENDPRVIALYADSSHLADQIASVKIRTMRAIDNWFVGDTSDFTVVRQARENLASFEIPPELVNDRDVNAAFKTLIATIESLEKSHHREHVSLVESASAFFQAELHSMQSSWPQEQSLQARLNPKSWEDAAMAIEALLLGAESALEVAKTNIPADPRVAQLEREIRKAVSQRDEASSEASRLIAGFEAVRSASDPTPSEVEFTKSLVALLQNHGKLLLETGLFSEFESSLQIAKALESIQDWREQRIAIVQRALTTPLSPDSANAAVIEIKAHLSEYPTSVYRTALQQLIPMFEIDAKGKQGEEIANGIRRSGYSNLHRIKTQDGWIYARIKPTPRPDRRFLTTESDVREPHGNLHADPPPGVYVLNLPEPSEVSSLLEGGLLELAAHSGSRASVVLLQTIGRIRDTADRDAVLQLKVLQLLWEEWITSFSALDPDLATAAHSWLRSIKANFALALAFDWVHGAPTRTIKPGPTVEARIAIQNSPGATQAVARSRVGITTQSLRLASALPVGILDRPTDSSGVRRIRWLDGVSVRDGLFIPVRGADTWHLMPVQVTENETVIPPLNAHNGVIMLFRRGQN